MTNFFSFGMLILLLIAFLGCSKNNSEVDACISRGIAYYKDIGSYPTLSNGEDAATKVKTRCNRTTTAF